MCLLPVTAWQCQAAFALVVAPSIEHVPCLDDITSVSLKYQQLPLICSCGHQ